MATLKQKKVAKAIVENYDNENFLTSGQILEKVGYSPNMVKNPKMVLESAGVQEELARLGFDEQTAKEVVGTILTDETNEPKDRLKAAEMVFKVHGTFAAEKHVNLNLDAKSTERTKQLGDTIIRLLRR